MFYRKCRVFFLSPIVGCFIGAGLLMLVGMIWLPGRGYEVHGWQNPEQSGSDEGWEDFMRGEFWRAQALHDIMPPWLEYAVDQVNGGFHTGLSRDWKRIGTTDKYSAMLGRHVFSLSAAYLMSGDEVYLKLAREAADHLIQHGWDHDVGGWYAGITETGSPKDTTKDAFTQMYANTGLALYFFATRDADALRCLERSNDIFQTYAWDSEYEGYYTVLNKDLSVRSTRKSFNPQIGILSSYLIYFYLADGRPAYRSQMQRDMDVALRHMQAPQDGYILDDADRMWNHLPWRWDDGTEYIAVGGNIETAWVLMRLYYLTGDERYKTKALELGERMIDRGWDAEHGGWYDSFARDQVDRHGSQKVWWIQCYGDFMVLNLFNQTGDARYLDLFRRTAAFWNQSLLDKEFGGTYMGTDPEGNLLDGTKGTRYKGSYHSMEHALLNYLYLDLYVHKKPVQLYFSISSKRSTEKHFVCPVEDPSVHISEVTVNGKPWTEYHAEERYIRLPLGEDIKVRVVLSSMR